MGTRRNPWLTPSMERILRAMTTADEVVDEVDLVCARPGGWWCGNDRVSGTVCARLLSLCLVKEDDFGKHDEFIRYGITECGRKAVEDPDFEPLIVAHYRKNRSSVLMLAHCDWILSRMDEAAKDGKSRKDVHLTRRR